MSVDQDLTVVVEAIDDDVVKGWLVPIDFHASLTRQRSNGSETRSACSNVYKSRKKSHPCRQGYEKKGCHATDAENSMEADDNYKLESVKLENTRLPLLCLNGMPHKKKENSGVSRHA